MYGLIYIRDFIEKNRLKKYIDLFVAAEGVAPNIWMDIQPSCF